MRFGMLVSPVGLLADAAATVAILNFQENFLKHD